MALPDNFDLRQIPPQQGMDKHPCGMFDFQITTTSLQETKDKTGAMLVIEFTSPVGRVEKRYNVANPSPQAVEIANKELAALGHAINIFSIAYPKNPDGSPNMEMAGHNLRGSRGRMEVAYQRGQEPTAEKPSGGYVEVRKVFDAQGNEPGKTPTSQQQPQTQPQQGNWNAAPQQQPAQQNNGWANAAPANAGVANSPPANPTGKPSWAS